MGTQTEGCSTVQRESPGIRSDWIRSFVARLDR